MRTFDLTVSTPDGHVFCGEVLCISARGSEGDLAVMAGHTPFVTPLQPCRCAITLPDESRRFGRVEGGLLTVAQNAATVLSSSFRWDEA